MKRNLINNIENKPSKTTTEKKRKASTKKDYLKNPQKTVDSNNTWVFVEDSKKKAPVFSDTTIYFYKEGNTYHHFITIGENTSKDPQDTVPKNKCRDEQFVKADKDQLPQNVEEIIARTTIAKRKYTSSKSNQTTKKAKDKIRNNTWVFANREPAPVFSDTKIYALKKGRKYTYYMEINEDTPKISQENPTILKWESHEQNQFTLISRKKDLPDNAIEINTISFFHRRSKTYSQSITMDTENSHDKKSIRKTATPNQPSDNEDKINTSIEESIESTSITLDNTMWVFAKNGSKAPVFAHTSVYVNAKQEYYINLNEIDLILPTTHFSKTETTNFIYNSNLSSSNEYKEICTLEKYQEQELQLLQTNKEDDDRWVFAKNGSKAPVFPHSLVYIANDKYYINLNEIDLTKSIITCSKTETSNFIYNSNISSSNEHQEICTLKEYKEKKSPPINKPNSSSHLTTLSIFRSQHSSSDPGIKNVNSLRHIK